MGNKNCYITEGQIGLIKLYAKEELEIEIIKLLDYIEEKQRLDK